jgi:hypothetical protein
MPGRQHSTNWTHHDDGNYCYSEPSTAPCRIAILSAEYALRADGGGLVDRVKGYLLVSPQLGLPRSAAAHG